MFDEGLEASPPLVERLRRSEMAALDLYVVYLGERLGLYGALAEGGPATSAELAARTGTAERYVREWLEHQAVAGFVDVEDPSADASDRRYSMPADHLEVLVDRDSLSFSAHKAIDIVRAAVASPSWWRRSEPAEGSRRSRGSPRAAPTSTVRGSSTCWAGGGFPRSRRCIAGSWPNRPRGSRTWPAGRGGRAWPWPSNIRRCGWTGSTWMPPPWRRPPGTPPRPAWRSG